MAENINIGGRLHSTATGNIVAGANEILDDTTGKKQNEINTETYRLVENINESLENLNPEQTEALSVATKANNNEVKLGYFECETESDIAAKVITNATGYILSKGGSIKIKMINSNTASNVTLNINSTGAKTLYYDGELVSPTNTWENNEIIEVYYDGNNYYYANNVESGGKFATGEKVKEVGIDSTPTSESNNIVKSNGVYKEINHLGRKVCATGIDAFQIPLGSYYIDASGNLVYVSSDRFSCTKLIPVNEGDVFVFTGYFSSSAVPLVAGFSNEQRGGFVSLLAGGDYTNQKITIPTGVKFVQAWGEVQGGHSVFFCYVENKYLTTQFSNITTKVNGIDTKIWPLFGVTGIDSFIFPLGDYYITADGSLTPSSRFSCTYLIPVKSGDVFVFTGYFSSSAVPLVAGFADEQRTGFVNLLAGGDYTDTQIVIPTGVNYVQAWGEKGHQLLFQKIGNKFNELNIVVSKDGNGDFDSILKAIIYANALPFSKCNIRVKSGIYDIEQEYKSKFGNYYFGNYAANYNGYVNGRVDAGLFLYPGMSLIGEGNVELVFNYDGDNINVLTYFSLLNTSNNVRVENLTIRSSETPKCRYIIHDDFAQGAGTNVFKNLILRGGVHGGSIMGCGMGVSNMYIIENCYLGNDNHDTCVNYHNNGGNETAKNKLIVSNCKGEGNCIVQTIGPSTKKTTCIVNNCEFWRIVKIKASSDTYGNDNMELIEFNNVKLVQ